MDSLSNLPRDVLFTIALELDIPDFLRICQTNSRIKREICDNPNVWHIRLNRDFPDHSKLEENLNNREKYQLLYGLTKLKEKMKIKKDIYELYNSDRIINGDVAVSYREKIEIPKEIGLLRNLRLIHLVGHKIENLPAEIGNLSNLESLTLSRNEIKYLPEEIGNLINLKMLSLSNNPLKKLPKSISKLQNLVEIYLYNTDLKKLPKRLGQLAKLRIIRLRDSDHDTAIQVPDNLKRKVVYTINNRI